jgi:hypothetical protein
MFRKMHGAALRARLDALIERMGLEAEALRRGAFEALYAYIDLPYEYTETSRYADRFSIPLYLLDLDSYSCANLQSMDELLDEKNVRCWCGEHQQTEHKVEKQRTLARLFFDKGIRTFAYTDEMLVRDSHLKERVAVLMQQYQGKRLLHVCGWQHLYDPYSIYDALNPRKVFAHDRSICI